MLNQIEALDKLCSLPAVCGFEQKSARIIAEMLAPLVSRVEIDAFGTVTGIIHCPNQPAKTVLLDAHIDQIGFIVTEVLENGFLRFAPVGGVDPRMLLGCEVNILCEPPIEGVISCMPPHLTDESDRKKAASIEEMFIDTGLLDAKERVSVGTPIEFLGAAGELCKGAYSSKSLDDRAGVLAILQALKKVRRQELSVNVAVLFSAQEEITSLGAITGGFRIRPDYAIAVDVSHAKTPDAPSDETFEFGGGALIGMGPNMNTKLTKSLISLAKAQDIDYQIEVMGGNSGTNAWNLQIAACGTAQALISIPLRYMHSPIETVKLSDIDATADLIAAFLKTFDGENCAL